MHKTNTISKLATKLCLLGLALLLAVTIGLAGITKTAAKAENHAKIIGYSGKAGFSTYILEGNGLYTVGDNSYGQLGDGTVSDRPRYQAKRVNSISNIVSVKTGNAHVAALDSSGYISVWGSNRYGQSGVSTEEIIKENIAKKEYVANRDTAYAKTLFVDGADKFTDIAVGGDYTAALSDGKVWTFGWNMNGQLGQGLPSNKNSFANIAKPVKGEDGIGTLSGIVDIEAAETACFALSGDGKVYAWGSNYYGLMSNSSVSSSSNVPVAVKTSSGVLKDVAKISAYDKNIIALTKSGKVYVWGDNMYGQAGDGSYSSNGENITLAKEVTYFAENDIQVVDVECASGMVYALDNSGKLYGWGMCSSGSMGIGSYDDVPAYAKIFSEDGTPITRNEVVKPINIPFVEGETLLKVTKILGIDSSRGFVECSDGNVRSWGSNVYGQAGAIDNGMENVFKPVISVLETTGRFDTVYKTKNYMIIPITVICITVALVTFMFIMLSIKKKKLEIAEAAALELLNEQAEKTKGFCR